MSIDNRNYLQILEVLDNGDVLVRCWPLEPVSPELLESLGDPEMEMVCPADQVFDVATYAEERSVAVKKDKEGE